MEEENKKVFEINPLGKWKRILLSLGDYFITFILSFILFNLAIFPLAKIVCNTQARNAEAERAETISNELLINSGIVISKDGGKALEENVNYSFKCFLSYYVFDEENPTTNDPNYGHKEKNEVIRNYYLNIKGDEEKYLSVFNEVNFDGIFEIGSTASSVVMKEDYKEPLRTQLLEFEDESLYSQAMLNVRDHVFARLFYLNVYKDILDNDFVKDGVSYKECLDKVTSIMSSLQWVAVGSSLISVVISWGLVYLLYPLINRDRRTPTMSIMKLDKLKMGSLAYIDRKNVLLQSFYYLVLALSSAIVMPILFFGLAYLFNLPLLLPLSLISLAFAIISLFIILFNQYNRSGSDILTFTVTVSTAELDELYREKNNG